MKLGERAAGPPVASARQSVRVETLTAVVAVGATFAAIALFYLSIYPIRNYRYPVGWDSTFYVWRTRSVAFGGLHVIGTIRAGSPLLMAELLKPTGQNAWTLVSIMPALLAGVAAVGAAVMPRAALGMEAGWVPVVGTITWLAFGWNGMMSGHLDNVLNAALMLSGFGAAVAAAASGRGAIAVWLLFAAGGLAHWPFYLFAVAVFWLGLALFAWRRAAAEGAPALSEPVGGLALAGLGSMLFAGLTLLVPPAKGGVGVKLIGSNGPRLLFRRRFFQRLQETARYWAFPLAALGAAVVARGSAPRSNRAGRRLFLSLMIAWTLGTVIAAIAQVFNVPVAGNRLLLYFFPVPILAGVFTWGTVGWLRARPGWRGAIAGGMAVATAIAGFATLAWNGAQDRRAWTEINGVRQVQAADTYAAQKGGDRYVVYLLDAGSSRRASTVGRWWAVVQSSIDPARLARTRFYYGRPSGYLDGFPPAALRGGARVPEESARGALAIVVDRFNHQGFRQAVMLSGTHIVAPGVAILNGPAPSAFTPLAPAAHANTTAVSLVWITGLILLILAAVGGGWAIALLPADPLTRVALAPGLGIAAMTVAGLAWDRAGLPFRGWSSAGPVAIAAVTGWVLALVMRARSSARPLVSIPDDAA